jgi:parallel beta-helix repeat protein
MVDGVGLNAQAFNNLVEGNYIGTDWTGTAPLGNGVEGVLISGASVNIVGGLRADGAGNLISANGGDGVGVNAQASNNLVEGNNIGTDWTGTAPLGNALDGVYLNASSSNTIGADNLISANTRNGVEISANASNNLVQGGNQIGTDITGQHPLGNLGDGVFVSGSTNSIGGLGAGQGNTICFNGGNGVHVNGGNGNPIESNVICSNAGDGVLVEFGGTGNRIRDNSMFGNGGLGIRLRTGGNLMLPGLTLTRINATTILLGYTGARANTTYFVDFYQASRDIPPQGQWPLWLNYPITTDAFGNFSVPVPYSLFTTTVTATVTDPSNNTSQFSNAV